jgi:hypothetical protein
MSRTDRAVSRRRRAGFEGRFGGSEPAGLETPGPQDALDRLAHAGVVLHGNDSGRLARHLHSPRRWRR